MRIVHFDQMFHPEFGDQINILPKYQVKQGHEVFIVTGESDIPHPRFKYFADNTNMDQKDKKYEEDTGVKVIRVGIKGFISGRAIYKRGFKAVVDELNPDILFCHFNDTVVGMYYTLISNRLNYPVVFDSHMLEMASVNPFSKVFRMFYRVFITPVIRKYKLKVIRTQNSNYVNHHLGIPKELTPFISFGTDTSLFYPSNETRSEFRKNHNINDDDFVVIYTGKLSEDKGGELLAKTFKDKFNTKRNIILLVVGSINSQSEYENKVENIFRKLNNRIIRFPTQKYTELPKFYQSADLCVFPKQCSLSFFDAQACGLPVIAEKNSINIDRLSYENGLVYDPNNVEDLRSKITFFAEMNGENYRRVSHNAYKFIKNNYDYEYIAEKYTEIMLHEYERFNKEGKKEI